MNKLQQQMDMFNEGGLKDEGGTTDPVSGNDVPIGSSKKEVRDDIPAMLSEGEFVFPADVVRFIGLEKLMMLRQEAKAGLKRMEEMGQMGNSEEATIPDDVPFTIEDLDMEEEKEYNEGGVVYADNGQLINRPPYGVTSQSSQMGQQFNIAPQQVDPNQTMQYTNMGSYGPQFAGQQPVQQEVPTFEDLVGKSPGTFDELIEYTNDKGVIQKIPFKGGEPLYPIPDGFYPVGDKPEELEDPRDVFVESAKVTEDKLDDASSPQSRRKAEQERIQSYKNTIKAVMEENNISASEAIDFIKKGKHKIKGIPVPGILFKDFQLYDGVVDETGVARPATFGLEQAAEDVVRTDVPLFADADTSKESTSPFVTTEDDVAKVVTGKGVLTDKEQEDKKTSQKTIKDINEAFVDPKTQKMKGSIVSSADDYIKQEQDAIQKQQELARKQLEAAQKAKGIREDERKARKEQQIELDKFTAGKIKDMRTTGRITGFEQGGLATKKPKKKKVMKRSGLASKK